jgi:hypothetical protein
MEISLTSIKNWIAQNGSYADGLILIKQFCKKPIIVTLLSARENSFNRKKMQEELESILKVSIPVPSPKAPVVETKLLKQRYNPDELPSNLKELHTENGRLIQIMADCATRLDTAANDKERLDLGLKIVEHNKKRKSNFYKIDHFLATGENLTNGEKPTIQLDENYYFIKLKLKNVASNLCKAQKANNTHLILKWEKEKQQFEKQLDAYSTTE